MKKLLLFLFFSSIIYSGFSQAYRPMLSNSSEWYYFTIGLGWQGTTQYTVLGDTMVLGVNYSKIIQSNSPPSQILLREDSLLKKVYNIDWNNNEALIYDFNLSPGDTFHIAAVYGGGFLLLDSITTDFNILAPILQNMCTPDSSNSTIDSLKIFHFNNNVIWVEGIGSLSGLLQYKYFDFGCIFSLTCHFNELGNKDMHFSSYMNQLNGECFTTLTGINLISNTNSYISLSPNPNNGHNILIKGEDIKGIAIYNIHGQFIKTFEVDRNEIEIDLIHQPKGVYLVKAVFKNGDTVTQKLILNR